MIDRHMQDTEDCNEIRDCDCCETAGTVSMAIQVECFLFGSGDKQVTLEARVPVWTCAACGDAHTGGEAEELRQEAVCLHLGRTTPRQMRAFREKRGLTQEAFAKLTGYGIASIKRWETGNQVPSASASAALQRIMSEKVSNPATEPTFRTSFNSKTLRRAATFRPSFGSINLELQAA